MMGVYGVFGETLTGDTSIGLTVSVAGAMVATIVGATWKVSRGLSKIEIRMRSIEHRIPSSLRIATLLWQQWATTLKVQNPTLDVPPVPSLLIDDHELSHQTSE